MSNLFKFTYEYIGTFEIVDFREAEKLENYFKYSL